MNKTALTLLLVASLILNAYLLATRGSEDMSADSTETIEEPSTARVAAFIESGAEYPFIRVVDGDTVVVGVNGTSEYVRLIGIDSPEPNDPGGPQCYAQEATDHMVELAQTGTVVLVTDDSQGTRDTYGRLLAYVELTDGTDLGERMLRDGYAREFTYDRPYDRRDTYLTAENEALENEAGLWASETCAQ